MDQTQTQFDRIEQKDGFYLTVYLVDTLPQTSTNYGMFFTARHPMEILRVTEVHGTKGSVNATLDVEKLTRTTAKGSGISILDSIFDLTSSNNTVVKKEAKNLSNQRQLVEGDRLSIKSGGTLTDLKDMQITLYCKPLGRGDYR